LPAANEVAHGATATETKVRLKTEEMNMDGQDEQDIGRGALTAENAARHNRNQKI